jgi:hypothetical protein
MHGCIVVVTEQGQIARLMTRQLLLKNLVLSDVLAKNVTANVTYTRSNLASLLGTRLGRLTTRWPSMYLSGRYRVIQCCYVPGQVLVSRPMTFQIFVSKITGEDRS